MSQDGDVFVAVGEAARSEAEEGAFGAGVAVGEEGDEASGGGVAEDAEVDGLEGCGERDGRGGEEELEDVELHLDEPLFGGLRFETV